MNIEVRLIPVTGQPHLTIGGYSGPQMQVGYFVAGRLVKTQWGDVCCYYFYP